MTHECLWYNNESASYNLLDFDPNGLTKEQIIEKAKKEFEEKGFEGREIDKAMETVYLIDIDNLKKVTLDLKKVIAKERIKEIENDVKDSYIDATGGFSQAINELDEDTKKELNEAYNVAYGEDYPSLEVE